MAPTRLLIGFIGHAPDNTNVRAIFHWQRQYVDARSEAIKLISADHGSGLLSVQIGP